MHTNQVESPGLAYLGCGGGLKNDCDLRKVVPFVRASHIIWLKIVAN